MIAAPQNGMTPLTQERLALLASTIGFARDLNHVRRENARVLREHQREIYARAVRRAEREQAWKQFKRDLLVTGSLISLAALVLSLAVVGRAL
jgi:hypothetical protein